jgi:hypothetical protein
MKVAWDYVKEYMDANPQFTYTRSVQQAVDWFEQGKRVYCVRVFYYPNGVRAAASCNWDPTSEFAHVMFIDERPFKGGEEK